MKRCNMENKEKLAISAKEAETATMYVTEITTPIYCQCCLLCENTRDLPEGMRYCSTPWVCDECKEAVAFIKDFKDSMNKTNLRDPSQGPHKVEIIPL